jgi:Flp pilus assembly protein TadD
MPAGFECKGKNRIMDQNNTAFRHGQAGPARPPGEATGGKEGAQTHGPATAPGASSPVGALAQLGFRYLEQGKTEEALLCFNRISEQEPDNPEVYNDLGYVHERLDRLSSALQLYRKALALDQRNVEAMINIAHIRELEGDYHDARASYEAALAVDPENVDVHFCLGVLYDRHDMFDEAARHYRRVLALDSIHCKALFNLSQLLVQTGDGASALDLLLCLLALEPDHAGAWNAIGAIHEECGSFDLAHQAWQQCLKLNPFQIEANLNLARSESRRWREKGDTGGRQEILDRLHFVLSLEPGNGQARQLLERVAQNR